MYQRTGSELKFYWRTESGHSSERNNIEIVKVMRRNVLGQLDVNRHFDRLVQMINEGFADGILIANMQFVSKDVDDACRKIAKVSNVGGAIYSVDDGRLAFRFKGGLPW